VLVGFSFIGVLDLLQFETENFKYFFQVNGKHMKNEEKTDTVSKFVKNTARNTELFVSLGVTAVRAIL